MPIPQPPAGKSYTSHSLPWLPSVGVKIILNLPGWSTTKSVALYCGKGQKHKITVISWENFRNLVHANRQPHKADVKERSLVKKKYIYTTNKKKKAMGQVRHLEIGCSVRDPPGLQRRVCRWWWVGSSLALAWECSCKWLAHGRLFHPGCSWWFRWGSSTSSSGWTLKK